MRVARAVLENENSVLTVSVRLRGEYGGKKDVFLGNPAIIGSEGAKRMLELKTYSVRTKNILKIRITF